MHGHVSCIEHSRVDSPDFTKKGFARRRAQGGEFPLPKAMLTRAELLNGEHIC